MVATVCHEPFTILHVEDDPGHAELVRRSFESNRIATNIQLVTDGEQALDYLYRRGKYADEQRYPMPHLVLLDLRLRGISGLEVLKQIKESEELHNLPVTVLTTCSAEQDVAKAYEYNVNSYVIKPLDFEKFNKLIGDLGSYWLVWNHYRSGE